MGCMTEKSNKTTVCPHCGLNEKDLNKNISDKSTVIKPGKKLNQGRYLTGAVITQDSFGITYIGYDNTSKTKVSVKEYYPADFCQRDSKGEVIPSSSFDYDFIFGRHKFYEEAKAIAKITDFPVILKVIDCFEENNTAYMITEYIEGTDLNGYLKSCGDRLSVKDATNIMLPLINALKELHKASIIHKNICPNNIFVTSYGQLKLINFCGAKQAVCSQEKMTDILDSDYAPEEEYQTRGTQDPKTDIYALTAVFYRMITGKDPQSSLERAKKDDLFIPSFLPSNIRFAIQKGMALKAMNRFQTVDELYQALTDIPDDTASEADENTFANALADNIPQVNHQSQYSQQDMPQNVNQPVYNTNQYDASVGNFSHEINNANNNFITPETDNFYTHNIDNGDFQQGNLNDFQNAYQNEYQNDFQYDNGQEMWNNGNYPQDNPDKGKGPLIAVISILTTLIVILVTVIIIISVSSTDDPKNEISTGSTETAAVQAPKAEPPYQCGYFPTVTASQITSASSSNRSYGPYNVLDGQYDTAWNTPNGPGQWIKLSASSPQKVKGIKILNGYTKYSTGYGMWIYYANSRPKNITVTFSDGTSVNKTLSDVFDKSNYIYQEVDFGGIKTTDYIKITINSIYPGNKWDDCCISEITVY